MSSHSDISQTMEKTAELQKKIEELRARDAEKIDFLQQFLCDIGFDNLYFQDNKGNVQHRFRQLG
jgi:hypothetical protein